MEKGRYFIMKSYVVYMLAINFRYRGLTYLGEIGTGLGLYKVYDYYT